MARTPTEILATSSFLVISSNVILFSSLFCYYYRFSFNFLSTTETSTESSSEYNTGSISISWGALQVISSKGLLNLNVTIDLLSVDPKIQLIYTILLMFVIMKWTIYDLYKKWTLLLLARNYQNFSISHICT